MLFVYFLLSVLFMSINSLRDVCSCDGRLVSALVQQKNYVYVRVPSLEEKKPGFFVCCR